MQVWIMRKVISFTVSPRSPRPSSRCDCGPQRFTKTRLARANRSAFGGWRGHQCDHAPDRQVQDLCLALAVALHGRGDGLLHDKTRRLRLPLGAEVAEGVVALTLAR